MHILFKFLLSFRGKVEGAKNYGKIRLKLEDIIKRVLKEIEWNVVTCCPVDQDNEESSVFRAISCKSSVNFSFIPCAPQT
jgi:hypothetical protein